MRRVPSITTVVTVFVVGFAAAFVFSQLEPSLLLADTTPAGGDTGAHVWGPAYLRDHLLPHGRITGWAPDWYAGMPYPTFYFPLPTLLIVLLDVFMPYGIAMKLVTVLGLVTLPIAAWAFGRLAGMRHPGPTCLAVATLPFLFDRTFTIYGGNIASTLAGEFSFSISLSLALVFLGVFARGLDTGRHRALAAGLLAATALCHLVPVLFAIVGALVFTVMRWDGRRLLRFSLPVWVTAACLGAFWSIPFLFRLPYTNDMAYEKIRTYRQLLLTERPGWLLVLAGFGAVLSIVFRRRVGIFLVVMAVLSALAFAWLPQGKLWNPRVLPCWIIALYLLAGIAVAEGGALVGRLWAEGPDDMADATPEEVAARRARAERVAGHATPIVALVGALLFVALPLKVLPAWVPLTTTDRSFIPDWVRWNYNGYERKAAYPEYRDLMVTMKAVGRTEGCGRAMWEYESEQDRFGTPMALMLLPYWTAGCIGSMEGLFFESSATTPYHFLTVSELSKGASRPQRGLPYHEHDVALGVRHLQLLGVKYLMAFSDETRTAAAANPSLRLVASSGPWSVSYKTGPKDRTWDVYEVADSEIVSPLAYEPVVMTDVPKGGHGWQAAAVAWFQDSGRWDVPFAASGPKEWRRVTGNEADPPRRVLEPVQVTNVEEHDDAIEFDVDRVGVPVLVKASYFPNWQASDARGVWRVTPNQMVVVPTSKHVRLHYGVTPVDAGAWALTLLGLVGLVVLWRRGRADFPEPEAEPPLPAGTDWRADDDWDPVVGVGAEASTEGD